MYFSGGENLSKKTSEEMTVKLTREKSEDKEINVAEEFKRITAAIGQVKDAVVTIKDSDVSIKNWHFAVDKIDGEYTIDFALKLTVVPRESIVSELDVDTE